jgi:xanthine dehydrogenase small subunit
MQTPIRFLFGLGENETEIDIAGCDPTLTVLDWLRLTRRAMGTKEGCAEGDCGACTVVVGRLTPSGLRYEAINSCIRFVPTLAGCHLITIEHLKAADGTLHPVQQAMVDFHGSQCGFCTPGIVMSLFALWLNEHHPDERRIEDVLAGNLCRCTGYAPIIKAAQALFGQSAQSKQRPGKQRPGKQAVNAYTQSTAIRLVSLTARGTMEVSDGERRFLSPTTVETLAQLYRLYPDAVLVAGATDVGLWVTKQLQQPRIIISLSRIPELQIIEHKADNIRFGAMVTHADLHAEFASIHPHLGELMRRFGGQQVRNAGTIGGNIANGSPIGDLPPALIALGATLHLRGASDARDVQVQDFFLAYRQQDRGAGEFIEAVSVPRLAPNALFHVSKISKRLDEDISTLCGAFHLSRDTEDRVISARLAFGGMAETPKRAAHAEAALIGHPFTHASADKAAEALEKDFTPLDDLRASAAYRLLVAGNLIRRFALKTAQPGMNLRAAGARHGVGHA